VADDPTPKSTSHPLAGIDPLVHAPARLMVLTYLYVVDAADFVFLLNQTGLTWGNLSTHLSKLEDAGYVAIEKAFVGKRPHTMIRLTDVGREAFEQYRALMREALEDRPGRA
jgi:DNA-binding MarR family transcriptional regulator